MLIFLFATLISCSLRKKVGRVKTESRSISDLVTKFIIDNITYFEIRNATYNFQLTEKHLPILEKEKMKHAKYIKDHISLNYSIRPYLNHRVGKLDGKTLTAENISHLLDTSSAIGNYISKYNRHTSQMTLWLRRVLDSWDKAKPILESFNFNTSYTKLVIEDFAYNSAENTTIDQVFECINMKPDFLKELMRISSKMLGNTSYNYADMLKDLNFNVAQVSDFIDYTLSAFYSDCYNISWAAGVIKRAIPIFVDLYNTGFWFLKNIMSMFQEMFYYALVQSKNEDEDFVTRICKFIEVFIKDWEEISIEEANDIHYQMINLMERIDRKIHEYDKLKIKYHKKSLLDQVRPEIKPLGVSVLKSRLESLKGPKIPSYHQYTKVLSEIPEIAKVQAELNELYAEEDNLNFKITTQEVAEIMKHIIVNFKEKKRNIKIKKDDLFFDNLADVGHRSFVFKLARSIVYITKSFNQTKLENINSAYKYSFRFIGPRSTMPLATKKLYNVLIGDIGVHGLLSKRYSDFVFSRRAKIDKNYRGYLRFQSKLNAKFYKKMDQMTMSLIKMLLSNAKVNLDDAIKTCLQIDFEIDSLRVIMDLITEVSKPYLSIKSDNMAYNVLKNYMSHIENLADFLRRNKGAVTLENLCDFLFGTSWQPVYKSLMNGIKGDSSIEDLLKIIYDDVFDSQYVIDMMENVGMPSLVNIIEYIMFYKSWGAEITKAVLGYIYTVMFVQMSYGIRSSDITSSELTFLGARIVNYFGRITVGELGRIVFGKEHANTFINGFETFLNHQVDSKNIDV